MKALEHCCFTEYLYRNDFFFWFYFLLVGDSSKSDIPVDDLWDLFVKVKQCIFFVVVAKLGSFGFNMS